ncbi:hypothetical protein VNO77_39116 [Canavalia gladiata]|uniref:Uncharacterized protein n=1 Tax=Canavalia gladiata TaxID=3824 RepID=A0AAN9PWU9_CANGL
MPGANINVESSIWRPYPGELAICEGPNLVIASPDLLVISFPSQHNADSTMEPTGFTRISSHPLPSPISEHSLIPEKFLIQESTVTNLGLMGWLNLYAYASDLQGNPLPFALGRKTLLARRLQSAFLL